MLDDNPLFHGPLWRRKQMGKDLIASLNEAIGREDPANCWGRSIQGLVSKHHQFQEPDKDIALIRGGNLAFIEKVTDKVFQWGEALGAFSPMSRDTFSDLCEDFFLDGRYFGLVWLTPWAQTLTAMLGGKQNSVKFSLKQNPVGSHKEIVEDENFGNHITLPIDKLWPAQPSGVDLVRISMERDDFLRRGKEKPLRSDRTVLQFHQASPVSDAAPYERKGFFDSYGALVQQEEPYVRRTLVPFIHLFRFCHERYHDTYESMEIHVDSGSGKLVGLRLDQGQWSTRIAVNIGLLDGLDRRVGQERRK